MKRTLVIGGIVASMVFGVVAYALAATSMSDTVTVTAKVNPKLELTLSTTTVSFGNVDPETTYTDAVGVQVKSNAGYTLSKAISGDEALMGLDTTLADSAVAGGKGITNYVDNYSIFVPYTTDANADLTAAVLYTAVQ